MSAKNPTNQPDDSAANGDCRPASCSVHVAKMTHRTNHFNANQKVWLQYMSGALAARVIGKYRGKGRYVSAWVTWGTSDKPMPEWKIIEVNKSFADRHALLRQNTQDREPTK